MKVARSTSHLSYSINVLQATTDNRLQPCTYGPSTKSVAMNPLLLVLIPAVISAFIFGSLSAHSINRRRFFRSYRRRSRYW